MRTIISSLNKWESKFRTTSKYFDRPANGGTLREEDFIFITVIDYAIHTIGQTIMCSNDKWEDPSQTFLTETMDNNHCLKF